MKLASVDLDWRAYFEAFCRLHGGDDLMPWGAELGKGVLVFEDGWTYSATDYAGPEWPPPRDKRKLTGLRRHWWQKRLNAAKRAAHAVEGRINWLKATQAAKSVSLQQRVRYMSEQVGLDGQARAVAQSRVQSLDLSALEEQMAWLTGERGRAEAELAKLKERAA